MIDTTESRQFTITGKIFYILLALLTLASAYSLFNLHRDVFEAPKPSISNPLPQIETHRTTPATGSLKVPGFYFERLRFKQKQQAVELRKRRFQHIQLYMTILILLLMFFLTRWICKKNILPITELKTLFPRSLKYTGLMVLQFMAAPLLIEVVPELRTDTTGWAAMVNEFT
ncbi:MAG: hypothetical protein GY765_29610, partial [bacterium]|nr:hypothetical protein [bacterium]